MAKKSLKRSRSQPGCMWNLINMFDFRQGRSAAKLLTDRRPNTGIGRSSSQKVRSGRAEKRENTDVEDNKMAMTDDARASVKELMAVEMINEQGLLIKSTDSEIKLERTGSKSEKRSKKKQKQRNRNRAQSTDMDVPELNSAGCSDLDLEAAMEELVRISRRNTDNNDSDVTPDVEKLIATLKLVLNSREDGNGFRSEEFTDALRALSVNKGLFLKLLRDQNSALVKHFQKSVDFHTNEDQNLAKLDELSSSKHWGFFRRSKSVESYPFEWDEDYNLSPGRIVVLKPGRAATQSPISSLSVQSHYGNGNPPYFSFTNFKRKLLNAMGKEMSPDRQSLKLSPKNGKYLPGWSSPNRNHFYTERFALSMEAKKHLSDVLKNGDGNAVLKDGRHSKSLGRILAFPEHNRSRFGSHRKHGDDVFITPDMRFSPLGVVNNHPSLRKHNLRSQLGSDLNCSSDVQSFNSPEGLETEEVVESRCCQEEGTIIDISSELSCNSFVLDTREEDSREVENEKEPSLPLKSELCDEVRISSPPIVSPSCSPSQEVNESRYPVDKTERPSPVSVLDALFTDDDISPASTLTRPVENEIQPLCIHFEEQPSPTELGICTRISSEDEESAFEYIEAVLLGSGLNWDEFLQRWLSSYEILDSSLFNEVELFSSQPHPDQKLLFDSTNVALKDVCETYFRRNEPNIRPVPKGMDLIHETWKRVERHLVRVPKACSLEQLVSVDLECSGNWMNLRWDVEVIGFVVGEAVFDELVEEFVMSSVF